MISEEIQKRIEETEAEAEFEGAEDLQPDDTVLGVLGEDLRKLGTFINREVASINQAISNGPPSDVREIMPAITAINSRTRTVDALKNKFWNEVYLEIGEPKGPILLRKGWQVVAAIQKSAPELEKMTSILANAIISAILRQPRDGCSCPVCTAKRKALSGDAT